MGGSLAIGAVVAQMAFWVLLALGVVNGALAKLGAAIFVVLWVASCVGLSRVAWWTGPLVTSYVAMLDIVLVVIVIKRDVKLL
jgi:hypothetical protein